MINKTQELGNVMTFTAPAGGVVSGGVYLIGGLFVVAAAAAAAGATFDGDAAGVFTLTKLAGEGALVEGQPVFWDTANSRFSIDPSAGLPLGVMAAAAATGDVTGSVRLNGISLSGRLLSFRKHVPVATINAGGTLLPAIAGAKYRLVDEYAIAVGGAAGTVTTVDILGTQAAGSVKLVAHPVASLTRSALNRAGSAGGTILADGASFAACDVNTAVTIGKTGGAIDTATHVDVQLLYTIE